MKSALVVVTSLLASCGNVQMSWLEEIQLQSGATVLAERRAEFKGNWVAGGGGGSLNEGMTLQLIDTGLANRPGRWSDKFVPILMDRDAASGEWLIVATYFHCDGWYEIGRPRLPYVEYRYRGGQWVRQPLSSGLIGRESNVTAMDPSLGGVLKEEKGRLSVARKARLRNNTQVAEKFRKIVDSWPAIANC